MIKFIKSFFKKQSTETQAEVPYKVEAPVVETTPAVIESKVEATVEAPAVEVVANTDSKPAKTAKEKKAPAEKKPRAPRKPKVQ